MVKWTFQVVYHTNSYIHISVLTLVPANHGDKSDILIVLGNWKITSSPWWLAQPTVLMPIFSLIHFGVKMAEKTFRLYITPESKQVTCITQCMNDGTNI